jgi:ADP-ribosyl-[dinitrogen reductase] hydrolase
VVSMCRLTDEDMRHTMPHAEVRLIDRSDPDENPNLDYVLLDAVRLVERLRAEDRTVLVHCVAA